MRPTEMRRSSGMLFVLLGALPVLFYFFTLSRFFLPVPILDDYANVLTFLIRQNHMHGFAPQFLAAITTQHEEYRFILINLLMAGYFGITGHASFTFLIVLGDLFLPPAAWLLWLHCFPNEPLSRRRLLFLPVLYLLFQLTYVEMLNFAIAGLQYFVFPFTLAAIHCLDRRGSRAFVWACLFAMLSCTASPNGFLAGPVGLLLLFRERSYRRMAFWCLPFGVMLGAYLYRYQPQPHSQRAFLQAPAFFFSFVGGAIENMHHQPLPYAAVLLGALICLVYADSVRTGYPRTHPFLFYSATWMLATAALVAFARSADGLAQSLSVRYKAYCAFLAAFSYLYIAHRVEIQSALTEMRKRRLYAGALTVTILFAISADLVGYRFLKARYNRTLDGFAFYRANPALNSPYVNFYINGRVNDESAGERDVLNRAIEEHIYILRALPSPAP